MSFSATDAAFEGFRVVRRHPVVALAWGLVYLLMYVVMFGLGADKWAALMAAGEALEPRLVAHYLRERAYACDTWYENRRVRGEDADLRDARLALAVAVRQALANGLDLLGVSAPERM